MNKTVYEQGYEKGYLMGYLMNFVIFRPEKRLELQYALFGDRSRPVAVDDLSLHLEQLSIEELHRLTLRITSANPLAKLGLPPTAFPSGLPDYIS